MASRFDFASLVPFELTLETVVHSAEALVVTARRGAAAATCPLCDAVSHRVQSHYMRQPTDLPCAGRRVRLRLIVRRFRCGVEGCKRQVFAERFGTTVLAERPAAPVGSKNSSITSAWRWVAGPVPDSLTAHAARQQRHAAPG